MFLYLVSAYHFSQSSEALLLSIFPRNREWSRSFNWGRNAWTNPVPAAAQQNFLFPGYNLFWHIWGPSVEKRKMRQWPRTFPVDLFFKAKKNRIKLLPSPAAEGCRSRRGSYSYVSFFYTPSKIGPCLLLSTPPPCHRRSDPYLVQSSRLAAFGRWWRGWIIPSRKCDFVLATKEVPSCALRTGTCKTQNKKHVAFICAGV